MGATQIGFRLRIAFVRDYRSSLRLPASSAQPQCKHGPLMVKAFTDISPSSIRGSRANGKTRKTKKGAAKSRPKAARHSALTEAEIREIFRRFQAESPEPKGELQYVNPYTLLIAVVLSAQATDAGVNKATAALFKVANTPQKMLALGEDKLRDYVKTIGLYRTKAKNVIALSKRLIDEFGG